jgi:predicted DNA-binding protein YlxM (UPF0122 family)
MKKADAIEWYLEFGK